VETNEFSATPSIRRHPWVPIAGLVVLGLAAYSNSFRGAFILDDQSSIVHNPSLSKIWPPWAPLISPATGGTRGRPIANLTFALNHRIGGLDVQGYHVVNLCIHILAGLALFGILCRTFVSPLMGPRIVPAARALAFAVSALWLVHPLTTESVDYLSQRTESLMGLCYLATLYCVVRGSESPSSRAWYFLAVIASFLGMASKEVMITAPLVILVYDRTFLGGTFAAALKGRWGLYLGLAASCVPLGFLMAGLGSRGAGLGLGVGPADYAIFESRAVLHYVRLSVWPYPLIFDYGTDLGPGAAAAAPFVLIIVALVVGTLLLMRFRPALGFAGFWFFAILSPTSSFVPVALQPVAENRMYLPLIAVIAVAAAGVFLLMGRRSVAVFAAVLLFLGSMTYARNADYQSAIRIWRDTVARRPLNARAHANLGNALMEGGQTDLGMGELLEALRLSPDDADSNLDLGVALGNQGRFADAYPRIQKALTANPYIPEAHFDLGWLDAKTGREAEAIDQYTQAIALRPDYADAHCNIADLLVKGGRFGEAVVHYEAALEVGPPNPELYFNEAYAQARTGHLADSIASYKRALGLRPSYAEARHNLEVLEQALRKGADSSVR
jgi:Tfp pilus assembly protein PilF